VQPGRGALEWAEDLACCTCRIARQGKSPFGRCCRGGVQGSHAGKNLVGKHLEEGDPGKGGVESELGVELAPLCPVGGGPL
jgi:hypothetical protein